MCGACGARYCYSQVVRGDYPLITQAAMAVEGWSSQGRRHLVASHRALRVVVAPACPLLSRLKSSDAPRSRLAEGRNAKRWDRSPASLWPSPTAVNPAAAPTTPREYLGRRINIIRFPNKTIIKSISLALSLSRPSHTLRNPDVTVWPWGVAWCCLACAARCARAF